MSFNFPNLGEAHPTVTSEMASQARNRVANALVHVIYPDLVSFRQSPRETATQNLTRHENDWENYSFQDGFPYLYASNYSRYSNFAKDADGIVYVQYLNSASTGNLSFLKDFLSIDEIFRDEAHIIADFNYVPLNDYEIADLEIAETEYPRNNQDVADHRTQAEENWAEERGDLRNGVVFGDLAMERQDSLSGFNSRPETGIAKEWRRNCDSKLWRDWVANCLIIDGFFLEPDRPDTTSTQGGFFANYSLGSYSKVEDVTDIDNSDISTFGWNEQSVRYKTAALENFDSAENPGMHKYAQMMNDSNAEMAEVLDKIIFIYLWLEKADQLFVQIANTHPQSPPTGRGGGLQMISSLDDWEDTRESTASLYESLPGDNPYVNGQVPDRWDWMRDINKTHRSLPERFSLAKASLTDSEYFQFETAYPGSSGGASVIKKHFRGYGIPNLYATKNISSALRHIHAFIKEMVFYKDDPNDSTPAHVMSDPLEYSESVPYNILRQTNQHEMTSNGFSTVNRNSKGALYRRAYKIRRIIFNEYMRTSTVDLGIWGPGPYGQTPENLMRAPGSNGRSMPGLSFDIKSPRRMGGKKVVSYNGAAVGDIEPDDIQEMFASKVNFQSDSGNSSETMVVCPFFLEDYHASGHSGSTHLITSRDFLKIKKALLQIVISDIQEGDQEVNNEKLEALMLWPFSNASPHRVSGITKWLLTNICPLFNGASLHQGGRRSGNEFQLPTQEHTKISTAMILLDPRNIVAHIGKHNIGKHIFELALCKEYYTGSPALKDPMLNTMSLKVYQHDATDQRSYNHDEIREDFGFQQHRYDREFVSVTSYSTSDNQATESSDATTVSIASGGKIPDDAVSLINSSILRDASDDLKKHYIFICVLLQIGYTAPADLFGDPLFRRFPFYFQQDLHRRVEAGQSAEEEDRNIDLDRNDDFPKFRRLAKALWQIYLDRENPSFVAESEEQIPADFLDVPSANLIYFLESIKDGLVENFVREINTSLLTGVRQYQDLVKETSRDLASIRYAYFTTVKDTIKNAVKRPNAFWHADNHSRLSVEEQNFFLKELDSFFTYVDADKTNYRDVVKDFIIYDGRINFRNTRLPEDSYQWQSAGSTAGPIQSGATGRYSTSDTTARFGRRDRRQNPGTNTAISTDENETSGRTRNFASGIRGYGAGGRSARGGFASLDLSSEVGTGFNRKLINDIKNKILRIDRKTNVLVMFSEFLCSQLFYGDLSDKELADGTSQFQSNKLGIFENLGLIVDPDPETSDDRADGQVKISPEAVYEIISEYIKIFLEITKSFPKVTIGLEPKVKDSTGSYILADSVIDLFEKYEGEHDASGQLNVMRSKASVLRADMGYRGEPMTENEYALFANNFNDYLFHSNQYFKIVDSIRSSEPSFSLVIRDADGRTQQSWETPGGLAGFSNTIALGFLPHVTVENKFLHKEIDYINSAIVGAEGGVISVPLGGDWGNEPETMIDRRACYRGVGLTQRPDYLNYHFSIVPDHINFWDLIKRRFSSETRTTKKLGWNYDYLLAGEGVVRAQLHYDTLKNPTQADGSTQYTQIDTFFGYNIRSHIQSTFSNGRMVLRGYTQFPLGQDAFSDDSRMTPEENRNRMRNELGSNQDVGSFDYALKHGRELLGGYSSDNNTGLGHGFTRESKEYTSEIYKNVLGLMPGNWYMSMHKKLPLISRVEQELHQSQNPALQPGINDSSPRPEDPTSFPIDLSDTIVKRVSAKTKVDDLPTYLKIKGRIRLRKIKYNFYRAYYKTSKEAIDFEVKSSIDGTLRQAYRRQDCMGLGPVNYIGPQGRQYFNQILNDSIKVNSAHIKEVKNSKAAQHADRVMPYFISKIRNLMHFFEIYQPLHRWEPGFIEPHTAVNERSNSDSRDYYPPTFREWLQVRYHGGNGPDAESAFRTSKVREEASKPGQHAPHYDANPDSTFPYSVKRYGIESAHGRPFSNSSRNEREGHPDGGQHRTPFHDQYLKLTWLYFYVMKYDAMQSVIPVRAPLAGEMPPYEPLRDASNLSYRNNFPGGASTHPGGYWHYSRYTGQTLRNRHDLVFAYAYPFDNQISYPSTHRINLVEDLTSRLKDQGPGGTTNTIASNITSFDDSNYEPVTSDARYMYFNPFDSRSSSSGPRQQVPFRGLMNDLARIELANFTPIVQDYAFRTDSYGGTTGDYDRRDGYNGRTYQPDERKRKSWESRAQVCNYWRVIRPLGRGAGSVRNNEPSKYERLSNWPRQVPGSATRSLFLGGADVNFLPAGIEPGEDDNSNLYDTEFCLYRPDLQEAVGQFSRNRASAGSAGGLLPPPSNITRREDHATRDVVHRADIEDSALPGWDGATWACPEFELANRGKESSICLNSVAPRSPRFDESEYNTGGAYEEDTIDFEVYLVWDDRSGNPANPFAERAVKWYSLQQVPELWSRCNQHEKNFLKPIAALIDETVTVPLKGTSAGYKFSGAFKRDNQTWGDDEYEEMLANYQQYGLLDDHQIQYLGTNEPGGFRPQPSSDGSLYHEVPQSKTVNIGKILYDKLTKGGLLPALRRSTAGNFLNKLASTSETPFTHPDWKYPHKVPMDNAGYRMNEEEVVGLSITDFHLQMAERVRKHRIHGKSKALEFYRWCHKEAAGYRKYFHSFSCFDPLNLANRGDSRYFRLGNHFHQNGELVAKVTNPDKPEAGLGDRFLISKNTRTGRDYDDERKERVIFDSMPYIYDWAEEFPIIEVEFQKESKRLGARNSYFFDLDFTKIANDTCNLHGRDGLLRRTTETNFPRRVSSLEKNYIEYLYSLLAYTRNYETAAQHTFAMYAWAARQLHGWITSEEASRSEYLAAKWLQENGVISLTPDIMDNFSCLKDLVERYKETGEEIVSEGPVKAHVKAYPSAFKFRTGKYPGESWDQSFVRFFSERLGGPGTDDTQGDQEGQDHITSLPAPFKLNPYPLQYYSGYKKDSDHYCLEKFKEIEALYVNIGAIRKNDRVCFAGIESGQMEKILNASQNLLKGGFREELLPMDLSLHGQQDLFQIELEVVDYFRPWLEFEHQPPFRPADNSMKYPRTHTMPAQLYSGDYSEADRMLQKGTFVSKFLPDISESISGWLEKPIMGHGFGNDLVDQGDPVSNKRANLYDYTKFTNHKHALTLSNYLKVYANKVMGLELSECLIPRSSYNKVEPISTVEDPGLGERNYAEPLKLWTKRIISKLKQDRENDEFGIPRDSRNILKYFLARLEIPAMAKADGTKHYELFDRETGKNSLFKMNSNEMALLSSDAYQLHNPGSLELAGAGIGSNVSSWERVVFDSRDRFMPFRFEQPMNKSSLSAAEILTSVNEIFSSSKELMDHFSKGFTFDYIVGFVYNIEDFRVKGIRNTIDGISISDIPGTLAYFPFAPGTGKHIFGINNGRTDQNSQMARRLSAIVPYLEWRQAQEEDQEGPVVGGSMWVRGDSKYPLGLRVRIKKKLSPDSGGPVIEPAPEPFP